jgi:hypothetical protein
MAEGGGVVRRQDKVLVWIAICAVMGAGALTYVAGQRLHEALMDARAAGVGCGTERWDVKTLSDAAASRLKTSPVTATVETLRALPVPGPLLLHTPRYPAELQVYVVQATLKRAKAEADSDFHVVIAGDSGKTMIVELPDPACVASLTYRNQITNARQTFVQKFGVPPSTRFKTLTGKAQVTGVLFFDVLHGQSGVAPNGAELHPVLDLR